MARSCALWTSVPTQACVCANAEGNIIQYAPTGDVYTNNHWAGYSVYEQCCIINGVGSGCASGVSSKPVLTGQSVKWRKQSGDSEGKFLGLSTTQLLIAGAVGVGAYLLMKKKK